jgi:hypothetical protein
VTGEGGLSGGLAIPPFTATVKRLGITFKQVGLTRATAQPLALTLTDTLTREELRSGLLFKGITLVPAIKCTGFLGAFVAPLLTGALSRPASYPIAIKAP